MPTSAQLRDSVTALLQAWMTGDRRALDVLMPVIYGELHKVARRQLALERSGHTLQPTALVHEAYLRLVDQRAVRWQNRAHFVGVAAQLMRLILIDHCRRKTVQKRGGSHIRVTFHEELEAPVHREDQVLALDRALAKLAAQDARKSRIAELRYFGGLTVEETAEAMSLSVATVMRDWRLTKAWLRRELT